MKLSAADRFVFNALDLNLARTLRHLADADLGADRPDMGGWMDYGAGEYRDLELALDLLGNLDAPL